ncbi:MAG: orotate phosphoribosyltransferase [Oscillospiraceae bacterium]|jgi:orotate phosphoribosyltransferase|nr:orotate phosphoribosyltransferase [Oscillospiraceae bacterium]
MEKSEVAKKIYEKAHITGEFRLRSGQTSNEYFDKYLFETEPQLLMEIAKQMKVLIPPETEVIAGLELGGIPVVTALSVETGLNAAYVRKKAKEYGTCKLAEGADINGKTVCVIEDVVTTGGQIIESVAAIRKRGAKVDTVLCVILRDSRAIDLLAAKGLKLLPAFTMEYIKESAAAL